MIISIATFRPPLSIRSFCIHACSALVCVVAIWAPIAVPSIPRRAHSRTTYWVSNKPWELIEYRSCGTTRISAFSTQVNASYPRTQAANFIRQIINETPGDVVKLEIYAVGIPWRVAWYCERLDALGYSSVQGILPGSDYWIRGYMFGIPTNILWMRALGIWAMSWISIRLLMLFKNRATAWLCRRRGLCVRCRYSLAGWVSSRCPECGARH